MAARNAHRVRPDTGSGGIGKLLFPGNQIVDDIHADKSLLLVVDVEVKFSGMRVSLHRHGSTKSKSGGIQSVPDAEIVGRIFGCSRG